MDQAPGRVRQSQGQGHQGIPPNGLGVIVECTIANNSRHFLK